MAGLRTISPIRNEWGIELHRVTRGMVSVCPSIDIDVIGACVQSRNVLPSVGLFGSRKHGAKYEAMIPTHP